MTDQIDIKPGTNDSVQGFPMWKTIMTFITTQQDLSTLSDLCGGYQSTPHLVFLTLVQKVVSKTQLQNSKPCKSYYYCKFLRPYTMSPVSFLLFQKINSMVHHLVICPSVLPIVTEKQTARYSQHSGSQDRNKTCSSHQIYSCFIFVVFVLCCSEIN